VLGRQVLRLGFHHFSRGSVKGDAFDLPGFGENTEAATELLAQAERGDLIMWVAEIGLLS
jgi:hypothetical protein